MEEILVFVENETPVLEIWGGVDNIPEPIYIMPCLND
jgi:hypothetical protein